MPNLTVPSVIGMYYYDAQQALLSAGLCIAPPVPVLGTPGGVFGFTADSDVTADSDATADEGANDFSPMSPGYVLNQSISSGSQVPQQTQVTITVIGFQVINQPGILVPVL